MARSVTKALLNQVMCSDFIELVQSKPDIFSYSELLDLQIQYDPSIMDMICYYDHRCPFLTIEERTMFFDNLVNELELIHSSLPNSNRNLTNANDRIYVFSLEPNSLGSEDKIYKLYWQLKNREINPDFHQLKQILDQYPQLTVSIKNYWTTVFIPQQKANELE